MYTTEDIYTTDIVRNNPVILEILLKNQTLSTKTSSTNIIWATCDYQYLAKDNADTIEHFKYNSQIYPEDISGSNSDIIRPRALKHKHLQKSRAKSIAEVFTPSWICNAQNNLVDELWFGQKDVFNIEEHNSETNIFGWKTNSDPILFPEGRDWKGYVKSRRLEMACGEGPYIVSRYDTTTGKRIHINERIGIIDRKFRILRENAPSSNDKKAKRYWLRKAYQALQSVYGFDLQGDNVFLTRESIFHSFCDYYVQRWNKIPRLEVMKKVAEIISWNVWQMDAVDFTIPNTTTKVAIMEWHNSEPISGKKVCFKELINK